MATPRRRKSTTNAPKTSSNTEKDTVTAKVSPTVTRCYKHYLRYCNEKKKEEESLDTLKGYVADSVIEGWPNGKPKKISTVGHRYHSILKYLREVNGKELNPERGFIKNCLN